MKRIVLFIMATVLSVGAWAENLWTGSETLAYYGFKLTDAVSMSEGDVLTFTVTETTTGWAALKLKANDMTPGWAQPGTELISTSAAVGTVKIVVTSEVAAAAADKGLWLDGNDCTVTSVDLEQKQATLNLYSSDEGTTVNYWGSGLSKAMFGAVQKGDLLTVTIKSVGADWGAHFSVTTKAGGDDNVELATAFISPDALPTTVKIAFTDDMVTAAKSDGLYLNTGTYTYTSVDIVYTPTVSINAEAGYATFGYAAALDLTDVEAYTVSVSGTTAQLTSVKGKKIPAGTGIILKGSGDVTIPLTTEATDDITDNDLLVSDGTIAADQSTIYVLANGNNGVGFYLLNNGYVYAGKAYLKVSDKTNVRQFIGFSDDTTGINEELRMKNEKFATAQYYNLQGQQVACPTKGLYVVNGKKVVITK